MRTGGLTSDGAAIERHRVGRGLNQPQLARSSGTTKQHISDIESGRRNASPALLLRIAKALGVPVSDLTRRADQAAS